MFCSRKNIRNLEQVHRRPRWTCQTRRGEETCWEGHSDWMEKIHQKQTTWEVQQGLRGPRWMRLS